MASNENLSPVSLKNVMKEISDLVQNPPEGIKVLHNDDFSEVNANIEGPVGTPYEGGLFKVTLKLGSEFPQSPPKGFFNTKIFHPNVSPKGEICVNTLKKDWKPEHGIKHTLLTIKCLLIVPNPESALNEEAGKLLLENYEDYAKHARLMTSIHAKKPTNTTPTIQNTPKPNEEIAKTSSQPTQTTKKLTEKKKSLKRL